MAHQVNAIAAGAASCGITETKPLIAFALGFAQANEGASPASTDELELTYFAGPGRAEGIRLILKSGGVEFKDTQLTFAEWPAVKMDPTSTAARMFGSLPVLKHGDFELGQSRAVQTYAADVALASTRKTAKARASDAMFQNAHGDVQGIVYACHFGTEESKAAATAGINESLKGIMTAIERQLPESGFVRGGDQPSMADLLMFDLGTSPLPNLKLADLSAFPKFVALTQTVGAHPAVAAYVKERGF